MELVLATGLIVFKVALLIAMLLLLPLPLTWLERKIAGHMQQRMGPMRVGWHGLLQPMADGIKLLTKEDHIPAEADRLLFKMLPSWRSLRPLSSSSRFPSANPSRCSATRFPSMSPT